MKKIIFPLKPHMKGVQVADLQDALQLFLDQGVLLKDDASARREDLSAMLKH